MARNARREPEDDPTGSESGSHRDCGNGSTAAKVADAIRAVYEAVRLWNLMQDEAPDTGTVADALVEWIRSVI